MSRIPLVRVEDMSPEQRQQYDKFPSNLSRGLLLTDQRLAGVLPSLANALRTSGLDAKLREGVILRVAALSGSAFERMQHLDEAQKAGWSTAEIAALESDEPSNLLGDFVDIKAFVDECVAAPRVSDAVFDKVAARLSGRDIATLILLIGHYMMVARFIATLDIELDEAPSDWKSEH